VAPELTRQYLFVSSVPLECIQTWFRTPNATHVQQVMFCRIAPPMELLVAMRVPLADLGRILHYLVMHVPLVDLERTPQHLVVSTVLLECTQTWF
jgi:hypothetical protein